MVLITGVLIVFYLFTMAVVFLRITESVQRTLKNYSSDSYLSRDFNLGVENDDFINNYAIDPGGICVIGVDQNGKIKILDVGKGHIDSDTLEEVAENAVNSDYEFGWLIKNNLFYYKTVTENGSRIAFADSTRYSHYLKDMVSADGIIFLVVLLSLYFIVRWLSRIFIKPVDRAWTQQQNFIADASHELKTPLTVILANCDILAAHPDEPVNAQMKWIESTNEEASHMKELVNKMLFLAKNESVKTQRGTDAINLSEQITKVMLQFEPVAFESGVEMESEIEPDVKITADQTAVNQIIHILVDNAVKYAGVGGRVTLSLHRRKNSVVLSTHNTGVPIPEEDLPHIFERFYRSDKARTSGMGYGLGLAICKSLAEQQKAEIDVTSSAENGTVFEVRFLKQKQSKKIRNN